MSRIVTVAVLVFVGTLVLSACVIPGQGGKEVTKADNGKTVEVTKGSDLKVVLESNPTTGYKWEVKEVDASILKQAGEAAYKADSDAVGAGGKETFTFNAVGAGQTTLKMEYRRPWETEEPAVETFAITIVVK
jgi:inhibitor of cysteine peptidase